MPRIEIIVVLAAACGCGSPQDGGSSETTGTDPSASSTAASSTSSSAGPASGEDSTAATSSTAESATTIPDTSTGDASTSAPGGCGDGICDADEDATSCCDDCGVCDDAATVRMETGSPGGMPGAGITPGGIADTHAYFAGGPYAELVYPFTIEDEPTDGSSWFWAQQFFFENTTQGGYTGVQANGIAGGQVVGKMFIGSIWDATEAEPGPRGSCEPFGGEGVGYSCRMAYPWRENVTYRMIVRESQPHWWAISVFDPTLGEELLLGTMHAPDAWGRVTPTTAGFAEYYGTVDSCEALPHAVALLHVPSADQTLPTTVTAGTYGTCAPQATSTCSGSLCG